AGVCQAPADDGSACQIAANCASNVCYANICLPATCADGVVDGAETDVDCGGGVCAPCSGGHVCNQGSDCKSGICDGTNHCKVVLYHQWVSPISGCFTDSYDSTAPTADGGSYPYNASDSLPCRAWKLAATICNSMPQSYFGQGNWTCPSSGGFTDPEFGTFCASVGTQYSCSGCPAACNAACVYRPLSLRNCSGQETNQATTNADGMSCYGNADCVSQLCIF